MVGEFYRLVRLLDEDVPNDFDYLKSFDDQEFVWTEKARDAYLFDSWAAFVKVGTAIWDSLGPVDIVFERVYTVS